MGVNVTVTGSGFVATDFAAISDSAGIAHAPESQLVSVSVCLSVVCPLMATVSILERFKISKCVNESNSKKAGVWGFEKVASSVSCSGCPTRIDVLSIDALTALLFCAKRCKHEIEKNKASTYGFFMD